jgi:deoxyguanosine kinase
VTERVTAYIGLGSNLGDRECTIREALRMLGRHGGIEVTRVSDLKETAPLGELPQPEYLNGVAEIKTTLPPQELLRQLKATEAALGRRPHGKWEPRPLDLDLLLFGGEVINTGGMIVPHPEMHLRSFVLDGLCQLDPDLVHPLLQEPVSELSRRIDSANFLLDPQAPQLVSVAGIIGVGKTTLAEKLAEVLPGAVLFEPYNTNPFLPEVYAGRQELALDSQLYFLVNRAEQLDPDLLSRDRVFVTDYVFDKEMIYARRLLNPVQLALYETIYPPFAQRAATPLLVIYLEDTAAHCLQRIHRRRRPYEQRITLEFLEALDRDYRRLFDDWKACPVLRVPTARLTGYNEAVVEHLVLQVKAYLAGEVRTSAAQSPCTGRTNESSDNHN